MKPTSMCGINVVGGGGGAYLGTLSFICSFSCMTELWRGITGCEEHIVKNMKGELQS